MQNIRASHVAATAPRPSRRSRTLTIAALLFGIGSCGKGTSVTTDLIVTKTGTGTGTVVSEPAGIQCGSECQASFVEGSNVRLTATADGSSRFVGWTGICAGSSPICQFAYTAGQTVEARFDLQTTELVKLSVALGGDGQGTVVSEPPGISCGATCSGQFPSGTTVTLRAMPSPNSSFGGWGGPCAGSPAACQLTVTGANDVTANFATRICSADGVCWLDPTPQGNTLYGVYATSASDLWAVGEAGTILRYNGQRWSQLASGTRNTLRGVYGSSATDVWAVGDLGTFVHWDGTKFSTVASPGGSTAVWNAVWGASASDVWAAGAGATFGRWNGTMWTAVATGLAGFTQIYGLSGTAPTDVWAVGDSGTLASFNGAAWTKRTSPVTSRMRAVWARTASDAWAVGDTGTALRWNGTAWSTTDTKGSLALLGGVFGTSATDVFAVGQASTIV